jgi:hypothetical protein
VSDIVGRLFLLFQITDIAPHVLDALAVLLGVAVIQEMVRGLEPQGVFDGTPALPASRHFLSTLQMIENGEQ